MRVIGGELRSRRLKAPPGMDTRPTPDRLRETLFDVLAARIEGAVFVDVYAGSGAVGIEALSRGASRATFIEWARRAVGAIRDNLHALGLEQRSVVRQARALRALEGLSADIVFLDPPYSLEQEYADALATLADGTSRLVVAQHSSRHELAPSYGRLQRVRLLRQGDNSLSFYE